MEINKPKHPNKPELSKTIVECLDDYDFDAVGSNNGTSNIRIWVRFKK